MKLIATSDGELKRGDRINSNSGSKPKTFWFMLIVTSDGRAKEKEPDKLKVSKSGLKPKTFWFMLI